MGRTLLIALAAAMEAGALQAADYGYLALRQADGTLTTLAADGLRITFADGQLLATQGTQTATLPLSSLDAMYFTTQATTAIASARSASPSVRVSGSSVVVSAREGAEASLHRLDGVRVARLTASGSGAETLGANLQAGVYIVKVDGQTSKIIIRQ